MQYVIVHGFKTITVDVPDEKVEDRIRIPLLIYNACWWDRLFNTKVKIARRSGTRLGDYYEIIYNWPARSMKCPEIIIKRK